LYTSTLATALPTEIVIDRCLIRGDPNQGAGVGISLNARSAAILDSRIMDIKGTTATGGGIVLVNSPGPTLIHGTVIEAAWRNVAIGEPGPGAPELFPSDIAICKSTLTRPLAWQNESWQTRATIEIEQGRRVLVAGSLLENAWVAVHPGIAVAISDKGASSGLPTEDIALVDVRFRNVNYGFDVQNGASGNIKRVLVENSEAIDIGDRLMRLLGGGVHNLTLQRRAEPRSLDA
jgi:hypothetical protein